MLTFTTDADSCGTSFHGHTITTTYNKLVALFGEPSDGDGGYKVNCQWALDIYDDVEDTYTVVTIYDWKEDYNPANSPDTAFDWHLGAYNGIDVQKLMDLMAQPLALKG